MYPQPRIKFLPLDESSIIDPCTNISKSCSFSGSEKINTKEKKKKGISMLKEDIGST